MACLISTNRKPSLTTRRLVRQTAGMLPGSEYQPRGKSSIENLAERARAKGLSSLVLFYEQKGNPSRIEFIRVSPTGWEWDPTVLLVKNVKLQAEKTRNGEEGVAVDGEFCELFSPEIFEDSEFKFTANSSRMSFMKGREIVGPIILISKVMTHEAGSED